MAIRNFTGDVTRKSSEYMFCSTELTGGIHNQLIFLSVVNSFLSIAAFLGNTLILVALHKESSLHPPSKLLLRSLAVTDLCVGITAEPLYVAYFISMLIKQNICRHIYTAFQISSHILSSASLFTLTKISVDRLLALLLGLRYRQVVTLKRTFLAVTLSWVSSIFGSTMSLWSNPSILWYGSCTFISLCVVTSVFSYAKIFLTLRKNKVQANRVDRGPPSQTARLNQARYRKTVFSALWVQLALVVCYLPYAIVVVLSPRGGLSTSITVARLFTGTLILLNSSLNPILYCWKIKEVREAVKDTVKFLGFWRV